MTQKNEMCSKINVLHKIKSEQNDNVDVVVSLESGRSFAATFFTLENIASLMRGYRDTGECLRGQYFWAKDIIVVEELSEEVIAAVVDDLLASGELDAALSEISASPTLEDAEDFPKR
jgi:hypothetical protein